MISILGRGDRIRDRIVPISILMDSSPGSPNAKMLQPPCGLVRIARTCILGITEEESHRDHPCLQSSENPMLFYIFITTSSMTWCPEGKYGRLKSAASRKKQPTLGWTCTLISPSPTLSGTASRCLLLSHRGHTHNHSNPSSGHARFAMLTSSRDRGAFQDLADAREYTFWAISSTPGKPYVREHTSMPGADPSAR